MKKTYTKPEIFFESFTLSTNIASDCDIKTNTPSQGTCAYGEDTDFGYAIFLESIQACTYKEEEGHYNGICYHTFESNNLFNS